MDRRTRVMHITRVVASEEETCALAASLARLCRTGDCILLYGDLGAGKTAFARGFIRALGGDTLEITSPTFTLVQTYPLLEHKTVWHYDLYRLKDAVELEEIGLDEAWQTGITLIEWPELAKAILPQDTVTVTLRSGATMHQRNIDISTHSAWWSEQLPKIKDNAL